MEVVYLLILLAIILAGVVIWAFFWSIRSGQFDDLEGPAHRILMDGDELNDDNQHNTPPSNRESG